MAFKRPLAESNQSDVDRHVKRTRTGKTQPTGEQNSMEWSAQPPSATTTEPQNMQHHCLSTTLAYLRSLGLPHDCNIDAAGLPPAAWQCLAELNEVVSQHLDKILEVELSAYTNFTRASRDSVASKLHAHEQQLQSTDVYLAGFDQNCLLGYLTTPSYAASQPLHLRVIFFLLASLPQYHQAAIQKFTYWRAPHWLSAWCSKWGCDAASVSLLSLQLFVPGSPHAVQHSAATHTVFVPVFST